MTDTKEIIQDCIISPLQRCIDGEILAENYKWYVPENLSRDYRTTPYDEDGFHEAMKPFYWRLLTGTLQVGGMNEHSCVFVEHCMEDFQGLAEWVGEHNFMEIIDGLAAHNYGKYRFFRILEILYDSGFRSYMSKCPRKDIEEEIEKLEVNGNRTRGELLCITLAYMMIEQADVSDGRKDELEAQLRQHWSYLVSIYSVMVRRIVGSNFKAFVQLANNVNIPPDCHPYIHIFYEAILLREPDLFPTDKLKDKLVKHMARMEDIMKDTPQEDTLDELCHILFGNELEEMMQRKHFQSYDELNCKVKQLENTVDTLNKAFDSIVEQLENAVKDNVPISVIENQLLRLGASTAWDVFCQLNALLISNKAWANHAAAISEKIMNMRNRESAFINKGNYYESGAQHNDHSHQLSITPQTATDGLDMKQLKIAQQ